MFYDKESDFEDDLVAVLKRHGWTDGVLEYPTEQDLIDRCLALLLKMVKNGICRFEWLDYFEYLKRVGTPIR